MWRSASIAGWIIGDPAGCSAPRRRRPRRLPPRPAQRSPSAARAAILDEAKVKALKSVAEQQPSNAQPRAELANLYFDAERYDDAITLVPGRR